MNFSIATELPLWFVLICLLVATGYALLLYRRDRHFSELPRNKIWLMAVLRFIFVFITSFLLLSPLVKSLTQQIDKPVIIIAQDNSESIPLNSDSVFYRTKYPASVKALVDDLAGDYEVQTYSFGESLEKGLKPGYSSKGTDFTNLFNEIRNKYANRNVGALILASDGIYNAGMNPLYELSGIRYPVYAIALGDTRPQKDLVISEVICNKMALLGNKFPVQVVVDAFKMNGKKPVLVISRKNETIYRSTIGINSETFHEAVNLVLQADQTGLQHYKVSLSYDKDEISSQNNHRDIVIDIIDTRQKVLILANAPHPDIAVIRNALMKNLNYDVAYFLAAQFQKNIKDYNLVILHQIPSITNQASTLLSSILNAKIPVLYILGAQSSVNGLNNLGAGLKIGMSGSSYDEAGAAVNNQFALFSLNPLLVQSISKMPPLIVPFGDYSMGANSDILFYQRIRNITTGKPLIFFTSSGDTKTGFISGEGIWRWKLIDFQQNGNNELFDELVNKVVQYMALQIRKNNFAVNLRNVYNENESLIMEAELYNESFELINDPEVTIQLFNENGKSYSFVFDKTAHSYRLNAGQFPPGDYSYRAKVSLGEKVFNATGKFIVIPINIEAENTLADYKLLYQVCHSTKGECYLPGQILKIPEMIRQNKNIVPVSFSERKLMEVINLKWLFFLILAIISMEWFLRKFYGSY